MMCWFSGMLLSFVATYAPQTKILEVRRTFWNDVMCHVDSRYYHSLLTRIFEHSNVLGVPTEANKNLRRGVSICNAAMHRHRVLCSDSRTYNVIWEIIWTSFGQGNMQLQNA